MQLFFYTFSLKKVCIFKSISISIGIGPLATLYIIKSNNTIVVSLFIRIRVFKSCESQLLSNIIKGPTVSSEHNAVVPSVTLSTTKVDTAVTLTQVNKTTCGLTKILSCFRQQYRSSRCIWLYFTLCPTKCNEVYLSGRHTDITITGSVHDANVDNILFKQSKSHVSNTRPAGQFEPATSFYVVRLSLKDKWLS